MGFTATYSLLLLLIGHIPPAFLCVLRENPILLVFFRVTFIGYKKSGTLIGLYYGAPGITMGVPPDRTNTRRDMGYVGCMVPGIRLDILRVWNIILR